MNGVLALLLALPLGTHAAVFTVGNDRACTHNSLASALASAEANGNDLDQIHLLAGSRHPGVVVDTQSVSILGGYPNCEPHVGPNLDTPSILLADGATHSVEMKTSDHFIFQRLELHNLELLNQSIGIHTSGLFSEALINATVILNNVRIAGHKNSGIRFGHPRAILQSNSPHLFLFNTEIVGNQAKSGAGMTIFGTRIWLIGRKSRISQNIADNNAGGALITNSDWTLIGASIDNNAALGQDGGGGLMAISSNLTISGDRGVSPQIHRNQSNFNGGGLILVNSNLHGTDMVLSENSARYSGSALLTNGGSVVLDRSKHCFNAQFMDCALVRGNRIVSTNDIGRARSTFAVYNGTLQMQHMIIAGQHNEGFGIESKRNTLFEIHPDSTVRIDNALLRENESGSLATLAATPLSDIGQAAELLLIDSTVDQNRFWLSLFETYSHQWSRIDVENSILNEPNTVYGPGLDAENTSSKYVIARSPIDTNFPFHSTLLITDPRLDVETSVPLSDSPAIDFAPPVGIPSDAELELDLRGAHLRIVDHPAHLSVFGIRDLGAFEVSEIK